jgi:hypothetical protein
LLILKIPHFFIWKNNLVLFYWLSVTWFWKIPHLFPTFSPVVSSMTFNYVCIFTIYFL